MYQDYEQNEYPSINENNRYNINEGDYHYQHETNSNSLSFSNNYSNDINYYSNNSYNNRNNYSNINHYRNNNLTSINETFSQNTISTKKKEEKIPNNLKSTTIETLINNKYLSKVTVENIRQPKDIIFMLDNFLTENKYETNYKHSIEKNKISFIFNEEEIAFNFTKLLNNMKNRNPIYQYINVHLSLTPNNNYNKTKDGKNKRGLSIDSIQRLFNGLGAKKHEKSKVKLNLDLGGSSPFLYPYEKRRNNRNKNSPENSLDNKLKDYNRLPIRVLDTDYKPLREPEFREEHKDKWVCPSNFKW
jgi:hypothetical protein